ncbi:MAG: sterol desaturase family protein [Acidimicrobiales bacterium]|jgi:sterol desaturase/sphingolipid hydroxylase (fatty acid hydroxylase superfamily)
MRPVLVLIAAFVGGMVLWTLSEYVLHRWFHIARGSNLASKEHLEHHARRRYLVNALSWLSWAGVLVVGLVAIPLVAWTVLPVPRAVALGAGWVTAYFAYEFIHAADHLWAPRTAYGRWARRSHFHHHFGAPLRNYGVTSPFWDKVFGTYERPMQVTVPRRMAMVWLLDDTGEVRPEHRSTYAVRGTRTEIGPDEIGRALANQAPTA